MSDGQNRMRGADKLVLTYRIDYQRLEQPLKRKMKGTGGGGKGQNGESGPSSVEAIDHVHHKLHHVLPSA